MYRSLALSAFALTLVGCGRAELSAVPAEVQRCAGVNHPATVTVKWDAYKATAGKPIKLWVRNPDSFGEGEDHTTLWTEQGPTGSAMTGNWVVPGTAIILTDESGKRELAELHIGSASCLK
ncbi:hypothetical protein QMK61_02245 [Fulvimonas sp. R45]|uniref:hypothetical protein n=1 Tax=Fulvimonas sp. R45 TaxID=3045937 RepID=UPI00265FCCE3|nr:hypothetical protein [Fulvimonas sp. R45]MDO1527641.1 hypothetical protein [Fulvimonas sp. R45]